MDFVIYFEDLFFVSHPSLGWLFVFQFPTRIERKFSGDPPAQVLAVADLQLVQLPIPGAEIPKVGPAQLGGEVRFREAENLDV